MGFFNKFFGFRWSLYIVQNGTQLTYAMHEHSVIRMLGYVMGYFANGGRPVEPWSLLLNFNRKHQTIKLGPEHFTSDGKYVTPALIQQIESIDPGWKVEGAKPVFEEAATKKRIKISEYTPGHSNIQSMLDNIHKPGELTFYSVMDEIFGKEGFSEKSFAQGDVTMDAGNSPSQRVERHSGSKPGSVVEDAATLPSENVADGQRDSIIVELFARNEEEAEAIDQLIQETMAEEGVLGYVIVSWVLPEILADMGIRHLPAIQIDEEIMIQGRAPSKIEIVSWFDRSRPPETRAPRQSGPNERWPQSLEEAVTRLVDGLREKDKRAIASANEEQTLTLNSGFGSWGQGIRNGLGLWAGNPALLRDCGTTDPDEASLAIIRAVQVHLRSRQ